MEKEREKMEKKREILRERNTERERNEVSIIWDGRGGKRERERKRGGGDKFKLKGG